MKIIIHSILKFIVVIQNVFLIYTFYEYKWWWFTEIKEFNKWYQNYGTLIWISRIIVVIISFGLIFYYLKKEFKSYPIFITYVILALLLKNQHPFSNLAVYTSFPPESFYYYIEDSSGNISEHDLNYNSIDIVDIYDGYIIRNGIVREITAYQKREAGKEIFDFVRGQNTGIKKGCFKVVQVKSFIENKKIKSNKTVLYEECIQ